jgi:hypothetical protein
VIWTDKSTKSRWVRSEANRALNQDKLIPIKLPHLTYTDLPQPFDLLQTQNIGEEDKIKAAVVAQLAKPAVEPSAVALLTKGFKYEVLTWVGIVGGALTLFTNLGSVLKLADWARVLVEHWKEWTQAFWVWAFGWLGIHVPPEWTPMLSFLLFWLLLTIGQAVKAKRMLRNNSTIEDKYQGKSFPQLISEDTLRCLLLLPAAISIFMFSFIMLMALAPSNYETLLDAPLVFLASLVVPQVVIVVRARHKLHAATTVFLFSIFSTIIAFVPLITSQQPRPALKYDLAFSLFWLLMASVLPLILLAVAPAKAVSRRLIFLALGLLLLIALNELSKLGLDLTAPKLQG